MLTKKYIYVIIKKLIFKMYNVWRAAREAEGNSLLNCRRNFLPRVRIPRSPHRIKSEESDIYNIFYSRIYGLFSKWRYK